MAKPKKRSQPDPRASIPDEFKPALWLTAAPYRPPNSASAIMHRDVLYAAIGRVLTQWELLETLLAGEYQRLIGTTRTSALRSYGSILASGSRCDMLEAAAEIELKGDQLTTFKTLVRDIRRLAGARNLLAHGVVVSLANGRWTSDDPRQETEGPFVIMAAPYNKSKFKLGGKGPSYIYSVKTVESIGQEIQKAMTRLGALTPGTGYQRFWRFQMD